MNTTNFLIQTEHGIVKHDFAFALIEAIDFNRWFYKDKYMFPYTLTDKDLSHNCVPIGSVVFVSNYLDFFFNSTPKPINVPTELFKYAGRHIFNGTDKDFPNNGKEYFVKDNDKIKSFTERCKNNTLIQPGNYQISTVIKNILAEWRIFVYKKELVGIHYYLGDLGIFPDIEKIKLMINEYTSSPIAYTLDVGIVAIEDNKTKETFVIEVHDFFSCGTYGFSDYNLLPWMFINWFNEYLSKNKEGEDK